MIQRVRKRDITPSPVWERGRGEGRTVQDVALRSVPLTTVCALFGAGLPSPCSLTRVTLSHTGEGEEDQLRPAAP